MYLQFAWRYFRAKKSANAINIIAWVTTGVIAFATCCQVLVLSVFNGFEGLVKSLYSSFYSDFKMVPQKGKTFTITTAQLEAIKKQPFIKGVSLVAEEKALLENDETQAAVVIKGVDDNYAKVSGLPQKIVSGKYNTGTAENPKAVIGYGVQNAAGILVDSLFAPATLTITLPKRNVTSTDPMNLISQGNLQASAVFAIQQEFDNTYIITNIDFLKQQMNFAEHEFSAVEISLLPGTREAKALQELKRLIPENTQLKSRYQQNSNLYNTMRMEKWAIYAVLTLILVIAAFNMISAVTMLVLEKKKDIGILQAMGSPKTSIQKIFLSEGLLLGLLGAGIGISLAIIICLLQTRFHFIKLQGGSFLIDYFPVKLQLTDILMVAGTVLLISFTASWFPSYKAARQPLDLK
ncbi:MAG: ABC transporter permease [Niastella sp.]|nr:ABC transporter permease [Niastella sp.]